MEIQKLIQGNWLSLQSYHCQRVHNDDIHEFFEDHKNGCEIDSIKKKELQNFSLLGNTNLFTTDHQRLRL